ncbi:MAG: 16S rRNA (guanine(527)-N(7))-methyltransferase RsmG, partial [Candidatus Kapaibacteriota bacterium]
MELTEFWTILSANGIILEVEQLKQIERFVKELTYWNDKINLISRKDIDNILENHILHSLSILKYVEIPQKANTLDVGTGGGLPGIPLKIARPDINMILIDSIAKKIKITDMLAKHTGLR